MNGNINMKCYDSNDVIPYALIQIPNNYFSSIAPLHVPTK